MKNILFFILVSSLFLTNCKNDFKPINSEVTNKGNATMQGTWKMTSYINYTGDGSVDTIKTSEKFMQMKMFSETKFMWNRFTAYHPDEWFGSGEYTLKNDTLIERTEYGSKALNTILEKDSIHKLSIIFINKDSYIQTEKDSLGNPIYGEIYHRIK